MKPKIKIISRGNGLLRMFFLVTGDLPSGYKAAPYQSKNVKHIGMTLINPKPFMKILISKI